MKAKFVTSLLFVGDIKASRDFYEGVLGQEVWLDHGECIDFSAEFSIMLRDYAFGIIFKDKPPKSRPKKHYAEAELYFEIEDVAGARDELKERGVRFVHDIFEQPWGQRVFRVYDPDEYIVEIGEPIDAMVRRFHAQGMSAEAIVARTSMPIEIVRQALQEIR